MQPFVSSTKKTKDTVTQYKNNNNVSNKLSLLCTNKTIENIKEKCI